MNGIIKALFFLILLTTTSSLMAKDKKICEINFSNDIFENNDFVSLQFFTAKRKLIKECQGIQLNRLIEQNICNIDKEKLPLYYFVAHSKDGKKVTFLYSDISPKISKIPVFIAFREKLVIPDTVKISGISGIKISDKELKKIKEVYTYMQVYKIFFNMNSIPKDTIDKVFKNYFLIFPQDQTTERWIGDLEKIEVYNFQE